MVTILHTLSKRHEKTVPNDVKRVIINNALVLTTISIVKIAGCQRHLRVRLACPITMVDGLVKRRVSSYLLLYKNDLDRIINRSACRKDIRFGEIVESLNIFNGLQMTVSLKDFFFRSLM